MLQEVFAAHRAVRGCPRDVVRPRRPGGGGNHFGQLEQGQDIRPRLASQGSRGILGGRDRPRDRVDVTGEGSAARGSGRVRGWRRAHQFTRLGNPPCRGSGEPVLHSPAALPTFLCLASAELGGPVFAGCSGLWATPARVRMCLAGVRKVARTHARLTHPFATRQHFGARVVIRQT